MGVWVLWAGVCAAGYGLGAIPSGVWITRLVRGVDVRQVGSGNIGATNVVRAAGVWAGLAVLLLDTGKGALAVLLLPRLAAMLGANAAHASWAVAAGLGAICGHLWPAALRFQGGKGVATSFGVWLVMAPSAAGLGAGLFGIVLLATRVVSLSSMAAVFAVPWILLVQGYDRLRVGFAVIVCMLIFYKHLPNIRRLLNGQEPRVGRRAQ